MDVSPPGTSSPEFRHEFFVLRGTNSEVYRQLVLVLAIVPLMYMRKKERPRRSLSIWMVDVMKIIGSFFIAEILTMIMVSQFNRPPPFVSHTRNGVPLPPPPPPPGMPEEVPPPVGLEEGGPGFAPDGGIPPEIDRRGQLRRFRGQPGSPGGPSFMHNRWAVNSVMLNMMEIFPGIGLVFCIYICILRLALAIKLKYCMTKGHILTKNEIKSGFGFVSGDYGYPLNKIWVLQQTLVLTSSIFIVRVVIYGLLNRYADAVIKFEDKLFWWTQGLGREMSEFVLSGVLVFMLHSAQAIALDYLLRIHHNTRKINESNRMSPFEDWQWDERDVEAFPLEEVSIQIDHEHEVEQEQELVTSASNTNTNTSSVRATSSSVDNRSSSDLSLSHTPFVRMDTYTEVDSPEPPQNSQDIDEDDDFYVQNSDTTSRRDSDSSDRSNRSSSSSATSVSASGEAYQEQEPEQICGKAYDLAASFRNSVPTVSSLGLGLGSGNLGSSRYGMVTASILNMAAASATVSARPNMFGLVVPQAVSGNEEELVDEVDGDGDAQLPSYDDSQRQQQELLRDSVRAEQQDRVIRDMKR